MARRRLTRSQAEVELNLAAMLDMAFQILAFFVLSFRPPPVEGQLSLHLPPAVPVTNVATEQQKAEAGLAYAVHLFGGLPAGMPDEQRREYWASIGVPYRAFYAYEDYAAEQLPWLWLPNPSAVYVYKSNLAGFVPTSPFDFTLNPEVWYYVKPAS